MTAEPTYEYRVVSPHVWPARAIVTTRDREYAERMAAVNRNKVQRRLVTPWEDVPDGE